MSEECREVVSSGVSFDELADSCANVAENSIFHASKSSKKFVVVQNIFFL